MQPPYPQYAKLLSKPPIFLLFFHLYDFKLDEVDYIMKTLTIVKRKDEQQYSTKCVILEIDDAMAKAKRTGKPYQTLLDPPTTDPRVAHKS